MDCSSLLLPSTGNKGGRFLCCLQQQFTKVSAAQAIALTAIHEPEMRGQWLHQLPVPGQNKGVRSLCCVQDQLTKVSAAQDIALTAIHEPEIRQRRNPCRGKVLKRSRGNAFINFRYQTKVRKQQKREQATDFVAASQMWGQRVRGCSMVLHVADDLLPAMTYTFLSHRKVFSPRNEDPVPPTLLTFLNAGKWAHVFCQVLSECAKAWNEQRHRTDISRDFEPSQPNHKSNVLRVWKQTDDRMQRSHTLRIESLNATMPIA